MPGYQMSHDAAFSLIETADIGGTDAQTSWVDMSGFHSAIAYVEIGAWDSGDDLDDCRIEAASTNGGTGSEEVTTDASGGNYDTDNPVDANGDFVILEIRAEDLPVGKPFIRLFVGEGGNTGTDNVTGMLIRYNAIDKTSEKNGDAATGSQVYVTPQT